MNELFEMKIINNTLEEDLLRNGQPVLIVHDDHTQLCIQQPHWTGSSSSSHETADPEHGSTEGVCWR